MGTPLGGTASSAIGINSLGQICGFADNSAGNTHAFLSAPAGGQITDLGTLVALNAYARGVNDLGQVVGVSFSSSQGFYPNAAFISPPNSGPLQPLGNFGGTTSSANGINNSGQVTGEASLPTGSPQTERAFLTAPNGGALVDLGTLGGANSAGYAVNASGQVTGAADLPAGMGSDAFLSGANGGPLKDLGRLGGTFCAGFAVNSSGQVTGYSPTLPGNIPEHAFVTDANGANMRDIGSLAGDFSEGLGINDAGSVVGDSDISGGALHAFIWTPSGGMQDLNFLVSLPPGYTLTIANGINNLGEIVGTARTSSGATHGYLLIPIAVQTYSIVSRMTHGNAGSFDVNLSSSGTPAVECRSGGPNGNFTIVFKFTLPLTGVPSAGIVAAVGSVVSSGIDATDSHNYIVNLTGVTNGQVITVYLANVNNTAGAHANAIFANMGVLLGDTNGDGVVNVGDTVIVRNQSGSAITTSNFREDINADGLINVGDSVIVRNQSGTALTTQSGTMFRRSARATLSSKRQ